MAAQAPRKMRTLPPVAIGLLIVLVIALAAVPLLLNHTSTFGGSDDAASDAISEIKPGTEPWVRPIWTPPGSEIESLLFALQAALGASVIGYFFGLKRGQRQAQSQPIQPGTSVVTAAPSSSSSAIS